MAILFLSFGIVLIIFSILFFLTEEINPRNSLATLLFGLFLILIPFYKNNERRVIHETSFIYTRIENIQTEDLYLVESERRLYHWWTLKNTTGTNYKVLEIKKIKGE